VWHFLTRVVKVVLGFNFAGSQRRLEQFAQPAENPGARFLRIAFSAEKFWTNVLPCNFWTYFNLNVTDKNKCDLQVFM
jgi:hypothetical protein